APVETSSTSHPIQKPEPTTTESEEPSPFPPSLTAEEEAPPKQVKEKPKKKQKKEAIPGLNESVEEEDSLFIPLGKKKSKKIGASLGASGSKISTSSQQTFSEAGSVVKHYII